MCAGERGEGLLDGTVEIGARASSDQLVHARFAGFVVIGVEESQSRE